MCVDAVVTADSEINVHYRLCNLCRSLAQFSNQRSYFVRDVLSFLLVLLLSIIIMTLFQDS